MKKVCPKCGKEKTLTEDNFYLARPRMGHKKAGWQSYCKACWKQINLNNKLRIKLGVVIKAILPIDRLTFSKESIQDRKDDEEHQQERRG